MIVLRRKTPRHDGSRFYAFPNPVAHETRHAKHFDTAEDAEAARRTLREPWLWEAVDAEEMARQAEEEHRQRLAAARAERRPVRPSLAAAMLGLALPAMTDPALNPPRRHR